MLNIGLNSMRVFILAILTTMIHTCTCPPYCPPVPILPPDTWDGMLDDSDCQGLVVETALAIESGPDSDYYAEALLYHALGNLCLGENLESVIEELNIAEELQGELTTVDPGKELGLLLRGQMVIRVKLGVIQDNPELIRGAEIYRDRSIEVFPEQREEIEIEFQDAFRQQKQRWNK